jgi:hypothetical protein
MDVPLYSLALFCGIATVRATTIMDNARVRDRSAVFSLISGLALLGFATAFAAAFLVLRATHGFFYRIAPVMGLIAIAVCVYGWLKWSGG